jgi:hypothetical protein
VFIAPIINFTHHPKQQQTHRRRTIVKNMSHENLNPVEAAGAFGVTVGISIGILNVTCAIL